MGLSHSGRPAAPAWLTGLAAALCMAGACAQPLTLVTARGATLSARIDLPPGEARVPAVVLAPGQGYTLGLPVLDDLAQALRAQGVAVFRFNWAYMGTEPRGRPSPDLSLELADLQAVLAEARRHPRVDAQRLVVAGKSLGSGLAWRLFRQDAALRAAVLLTPVCSRVRQAGQPPVPEARENYPGLDAELRPSLWIAGDQDPLCAAPVLYGFAASAPPVARVAIVGGDHVFDSPGLPAPQWQAARERRLGAVSALVGAFVADALTDPVAAAPAAPPAARTQ